MNIGEKILELRKSINLSQEELADKIGVTRQTISKWELGDTCPDLKQANKLAKVFNISLDKLTNNIILSKIDKNEKNGKKLLRVMTILCSVLFLLFFVELIAISFYFLGINKNKVEGALVLWCYTENKEEAIHISYDNTNDIMQIDAPIYIEENILNKKDYTNAVILIKDILEFYENNNGYCKWLWYNQNNKENKK